MDNAGGGLRGLRAVSSEALLDAIRDSYGIACDAPPVDLGGSSNLNLLVGHDGDRWVVRVYRPYVTAERLRDIHLVRHQLGIAGVPSNGLRATRDGEEWFVLDGRLAEVEHFVDRDGNMDSWLALEAGMPVLARIHACLRNVFVGEAGRYPLFANYVGPSEALAATVRGVDRIRRWDPLPAELELAADAEELARALFDVESPFVELPRQLVHGDFWDNNVFLRDGEVVFVTDFDFMGERRRIDDLALSIFFMCMKSFEEPVSDEQLASVGALLDCYDAHADTPLSAIERAALPPAIARQPLWSIGGWVALLDDEEAARRHAAGSHNEVRWALHLMSELDRWRAACA